MSFFDLVKSALVSLKANKTRTSLTMLGIVIGIASVITMIGIGSGAQATVESSLSSLGTNLLTITSGSVRNGVVQQAAGTSSSLTMDDVKAIESSPNLKDVAAISPEITRSAQIIANGNNTNTQVSGVVPDYAVAHNYVIEKGVFITKEHNDILAKVAVLGPDTAKSLFGESDPIGQTIKINKSLFKVVGVTQSKGSNGFINSDDIVFIPLSTGQSVLFGQASLRQIVVQSISSDSLGELQADITELLLVKHNISDSQDADFSVRNSADTLSALSTITATLTGLLAGIAGISLLVGGIGIMNIMIVTVTERTREIGLRKALGATNNVIRMQFLVEAAVLTIVGGIVGIIVGALLTYGAKSLLSIDAVITPSAIFTATSVSTVIGIVFGYYPAYKASKLNPIEALRYE